MPFVFGVLMLASISPELTVPIEIATTTSLQMLATQKAQEHGLSEKMTTRLLNTVTCESNWVPTSTSKTGDFGIAQINRKYHPEITMRQMLDPEWSLDWMAEQFSRGKSYWWVCYNLLYG